MNVDFRGRRAGAEYRKAIDEFGASDRTSLEGFEHVRRRTLRNRRIGAGLLAAAVTIGAIVLVQKAFTSGDRTPAAPLSSNGLVLFGDWDPRAQNAEWYTVRPDGSSLRDLGVSATCATWFPDGSKILITNDDAVRPGRPLRPALVDPDGSNLRPLDAVREPDLNLGCGDVSPDGATVALEGFGQDGHPELDGIYAVRASDGGGLRRLVEGPVSPPRYSPDGTRLAYFDTKDGVSPSGSGALFVMDADGSDPTRITPWGFAFDDHAWSPDARWIVFQRPYGQLYLVHPDGSDLHRVPLDLPAGDGALNPSWSPDGRWIAFSRQGADASQICVVRPDGTGLRRVTSETGRQLQHPDWAAGPRG